jgi:hypothetical protein
LHLPANGRDRWKPLTSQGFSSSAIIWKRLTVLSRSFRYVVSGTERWWTKRSLANRYLRSLCFCPTSRCHYVSKANATSDADAFTVTDSVTASPPNNVINMHPRSLNPTYLLGALPCQTSHDNIQEARTHDAHVPRAISPPQKLYKSLLIIFPPWVFPTMH